LGNFSETSDTEGRYVANIVVGTLELNGCGKYFLINIEVLKKVNYSTISKLFDRSLQIILPNGIKHDHVLLLLSDGATYMVKSGKAIKIFYSEMEHVTCLAHDLHRMTEEIINNFPTVDQLISN